MTRQGLLAAAVLVYFLVGVRPAVSSDAPQASPDAPAVRVGDIEVFRLHAGAPGVSAAERAQLANQRIERALADPAVGPEHLRVHLVGKQPAVFAGKEPLVVVGTEDASRHHSTPDLLAEHWAERMRGPFADVKNRRFSLRLLMRYLLAIAYPVAFLLAITGLRAARRSGLAALYRLSPAGPSPLRLGGLELVGRARLLSSAVLLLRAAVAFAYAAAAYLFLVATFYHFPATRTFGLQMFEALAGALSAVGAAFASQIGWGLSVLLVGAAAYAVLGFLERLFDAIEAGQLRLAPYITQENADAVETLANGLVYLTAFTLLLLLLPGEGGRLGLGVLAFLGLAMALACAPILRQFMAGISLAFLGSHRFGSRILWQGREATLLRRRLFHTAVRLRGGRRCLVPNQDVIASSVLPVEDGQERLSFELKLSRTEGDIGPILEDLAAWATEFGKGAGVRLAAVEEGALRFKVFVPAMVATDDHFVSTASDGLRAIAEEGGSRLLAFAPEA